MDCLKRAAVHWMEGWTRLLECIHRPGDFGLWRQLYPHLSVVDFARNFKVVGRGTSNFKNVTCHSRKVRGSCEVLYDLFSVCVCVFRVLSSPILAEVLLAKHKPRKSVEGFCLARSKNEGPQELE